MRSSRSSTLISFIRNYYTALPEMGSCLDLEDWYSICSHMLTKHHRRSQSSSRKGPLDRNRSSIPIRTTCHHHLGLDDTPQNRRSIYHLCRCLSDWFHSGTLRSWCSSPSRRKMPNRVRRDLYGTRNPEIIHPGQYLYIRIVRFKPSLSISSLPSSNPFKSESGILDPGAT